MAFETQYENYKMCLDFAAVPLVCNYPWRAWFDQKCCAYKQDYSSARSFSKTILGRLTTLYRGLLLKSFVEKKLYTNE